MVKRMLLTAAVALAVVAPATASPAAAPMRGVVFGSSHGIALVSTPGGKVTVVRGRAAVGARVLVANGRLVVLRPSPARAALVTRVARDVAPALKIEIEGVVSAVGLGTLTLTVKGQQLTVQLPAGLTLPASLVGRAIELEIEIEIAGLAPNPRDDDEDELEIEIEHGAAMTTAPSVRVGSGNRGPGGGDGGGHSGSGN